MDDEADAALLPRIETVLRAQRWLLEIPQPLLPLYTAGRDMQRRPVNRWIIPCFTVTFDLFFLAQFKTAPELVPLSGLLRLGLMTPCVLLFVLLDRRGRLGRLYEPLLFLLALAPGVISAILCLRTTSTTTLSDIRATPLILLSTGMLWRLTPPAMLANAMISATVFIAGLIGSPCVPRAELGSLILMELAIATTVIAFNLQLERRDRRVFLLNQNERIRRAALHALNRGLLRQTQTDALTGVANRRCFDEVLLSQWERCLADRQPLGLIMIDIDHFKKFNDHYGHQGGDDCLRRVAAQARAQVRAGCLFARYGGEEFAVILPGATLPATLGIAERMRAAVAAFALPHRGAGADAIVTLSLGAASVVPTDPNGAARLVELADDCLYAAKRAGRNQVGRAACVMERAS